jgi:hypothetical protein
LRDSCVLRAGSQTISAACALTSARRSTSFAANHEDFGWLASLPVDPASRTAQVDGFDIFRYVPDGTVLAAGGGVRLGFLGGVEEISGEPHIDRAAYDALMSLSPGSVDVLVTHEGPYGSSTGYRGDTHGSPLISDLLHHLRPSFHVAGHGHQLSGPRGYGATTYVGLDALVASRRRHPEARGLKPGCLAVLDTGARRLTPVTDEWLGDIETPFDFDTWCEMRLPG